MRGLSVLVEFSASYDISHSKFSVLGIKDRMKTRRVCRQERAGQYDSANTICAVEPDRGENEN